MTVENTIHTFKAKFSVFNQSTTVTSDFHWRKQNMRQ